MQYVIILRFGVDLFNVDRLQLNYFEDKFQLSIHLRLKELSPYLCSYKKGYLNTAQFRAFCINGMDVTNGLKVRVKTEWKFIIETIMYKNTI